MAKAWGTPAALKMSSSETSAGSRASQHAPLGPVAVRTKPAFDNFATTRRTKLALVLTLLASSVEVLPPLRWRHPKPAITCTAIENCVFNATTVTLFVTDREGKRDFGIVRTRPRRPARI